MYNPYNWEIVPKESKYEKWNRLLNDISRLYAEQSCAMLGLQLAIMNLKDSLDYEYRNGKLCPNTEHDIDRYLEKLDEYETITEEIEKKKKIIDRIY